jgi:quinoprotein glucose dehydrogenase
MAEGITASRWSGTLNVPDPVACSVDPQGRVYVTSTLRRKAADLDIREHPEWIPDDVGLQSVEDKSAFLKKALPPGKYRSPKASVTDLNQDGSVDWKDLTVLSERIYQLRDTDGDGTADRMTVFAEGFHSEVTGIAAGVLYHDGWVYATIAPDLWRFKDTDDDGVADIREVLVHGFGMHLAYAGHDMHGLSVGPDGRIYWSIGDKGVQVVSKEGRRFSYPNQGCVLRVEPDGTGFEVFAHGLRNPQEPAFDAFGNLIAVDNDADFKGEKERLVFIPEASDHGWRCNYQYMGPRSPWLVERLWETPFPGQSSHHLPPLAYSTNGPAGFKHDPGTALGPAQRNAFFLHEFPSGVLRGFTLTPRGASFELNPVETLSSGIMAVGNAWHPDGSLYAADWSGGYPLDGKGAVWRFDAPSGKGDTLRKQTHTLLSTGFAQLGPKKLTGLLGHADQRVRLGAQFELARQKQAGPLLDTARNPKAGQFARLHAIWGLGQLLRHRESHAADLLPLLKDNSPLIRAQTATLLSESDISPEQAALLLPLLTDTDPKPQLHAAIALGRLQLGAATPALLQFAEKSGSDPLLRHAAVSGLTGCATAGQLSETASHHSPQVRTAAVLALGRQGSREAASFLDDKDPAIAAEAARAIHDGTGIPEALPALAAKAEAAARTARRDFAARAINAVLRLGMREGASALLKIALEDGVSSEIREEALGALVAWSKPPRLDRVDGFARILAPAPVQTLLEPELARLLAVRETALRQSAVELMLGHGLKSTPELVAGLVSESSSEGALRAGALRLMGAHHRSSPLWGPTLETALSAEAPAELQEAALDLLLPEKAGHLAAQAERLLAAGPISVKQHVIRSLAAARNPDCDRILGGLARQLASQKAPPALQLDILEAAQSRAGEVPELADATAAYLRSAAGIARRELEEGGRADSGKDLVANHLGANCLACHALGDTGSSVGPNLRSIGLQHPRPYLLEALIQPNARIAKGFGIASATLRDGSVLTGMPLDDSNATLLLQLPDNSQRSLAKADLTSFTPPVSVMPPMLGILSPGEIRDVVAYLSMLRAKPKAAAEH